MPGIGVSMSLTLEYFIHPDFILWVLYFLPFLDWVKSCSSVSLRFQAKTKVIQTNVGTKVVKKPSWQDTQETKNSKKSQNMSELVKFNSKSVKVF